MAKWRLMRVDYDAVWYIFAPVKSIIHLNKTRVRFGRRSIVGRHARKKFCTRAAVLCCTRAARCSANGDSCGSILLRALHWQALESASGAAAACKQRTQIFVGSSVNLP